ncbi:hypothetical protein FRC09_001627 [Ceratobasidium sp. 395]|nr:hypothetical protein FRC09_001627 [Ceratobasidium sp. 395]
MLRWRRWAANVLVRGLYDAKGVRSGNIGTLQVVQRHSSIVTCPGAAQSLNRVVSVTGSIQKKAVAAAIAATPTAAHNSSSTKAVFTSIQTLRALVSNPGTSRFDPSSVYTAYLGSKPHLNYLSRREFSNLIALFGACSAYQNAENLPSTAGFILSESQRSVLVRASFGREWWDVVLEIGADHSALGRRTADVDRYWLMLAHLGLCRSQGRTQVYHADRTDIDIHNLESASTKVHTSCDRLPTGSTHLTLARVHYTALARNHLDESVHYAYLRALLDVYPVFADEARAHLASALGDLLANARFRFEPRLARLFWSVLHTVDFIHPERQTLLDSLALRSSLSTSTHKHVLRTQRLTHPDSDSDEDPVVALRCAILDPSTSDEPWVRREAELIVHHLGQHRDRAWSSLVALAGRTPPRALVHSPPRRINVLLGLRQGEDEEQRVDRLWDVWMTILGAEIRCARSGLDEQGQGEVGTGKVDRTILLSFLRAAAIRRSDRVVSGAERLLPVFPCVKREQDEIDSAGMVVDPRESLSVVLGAARACLGTTNLTVLYARMQAAGFKTRDGRFPDTYLAKLVELLLAFRAPNVAWSIAQQCRGLLPVELVEALASSCAHSGLLDQAVALLSDARLSVDTRFSISLVCLRQCSRRRITPSRNNALELCDCLGPRLDQVPVELHHTAIWTALNAGFVRLAGLMGMHWRLSRRMQHRLATGLAKARLCNMALKVTGESQTDRLAGLGARQRTGSHSADSRVARGEMNTTRSGNILISRAWRHRRKRLSGRAQVRATLTVLARLLRPHSSTRGHFRSKPRVGARLSFTPDAVTLNILCRAVARCTSGLASPRLRALFDQLAQAGMCGPPGNHFGTLEADGRDRFIIALAGVVRGSDARVSFVRHTRPLLKTFLRGFRARRDEEAARVVVGLLEAEDSAWRSGQTSR